MDKTFGKYLIRTTVVMSGLRGDQWSAHWKVFDTERGEAADPIADGETDGHLSFEAAATRGHGEAVLWIQGREGGEQMAPYSDFPSQE